MAWMQLGWRSRVTGGWKVIDVKAKIKPCPYCGGNGEITSYSESEWLVACGNSIECKMMPITPIAKTREEAIDIWNERWDTEKALELCEKAFEIINAEREKEQVPLAEIIRCRDCEHYDTYNCSEGCGWCELLDTGRWDNGYCEKAEIKGGAQ